MPDFPLGRIHVPDDRDANFPMRLVAAPPPVPSNKSKLWRAQPNRLNQGSRGACVGFTGANWMGALPIYDRVTDKTGFDLYWACKQIDGIPDVEGTYDRALAKVLVAQGRIERYVWATTIEELRNWVQTTGPVMVGTTWYDQMFNPDHQHLLWPVGNPVGGHEWLVRGFEMRKFQGYTTPQPCYRMRNSWGPNWGDNGEAYILEASLKMLVFDQGGDALGAVEKKP